VILTNRHVIEDADEITVTFSDGTSLGATVAAAAAVDIALLRVKPPRKLPAVRWGNSAALRQGMPVLAIGNPLGYGSSVTMGIVSALERDIASSPYDDYVQTDAPINPGSSGGPLFNLAGEVVGVNTAIGTTSATSGSIGIAFAIPSNDAQFVVGRLLQFDRVRVGWLPLSVHKTTAAVAEAVGLAAARGVIVTGLLGAGPSLGAVVAPGDVILSVDGAPVHDTRTFNRAVGVLPVGTIAPLVLWRDGREAVVKVQIEDNPDDMRRTPSRKPRERSPEADGPDLGLNLAALTSEARTRLKLTEAETGLMVTQVESFSPAAEQGLLVGEAILMVQREKVRSVRDFWSKLERARDGGRGRILLLVRNANGMRWVALAAE
jgi:serine protease Do